MKWTKKGEGLTIVIDSIREVGTELNLTSTRVWQLNTNAIGLSSRRDLARLLTNLVCPFLIDL